MGDPGIIIYTLVGGSDLQDLASVLRERPEAEVLRVKVRGRTDARTLSSLSDLAEDHGVRLRFDADE